MTMVGNARAGNSVCPWGTPKCPSERGQFVCTLENPGPLKAGCSHHLQSLLRCHLLSGGIVFLRVCASVRSFMSFHPKSRAKSLRTGGSTSQEQVSIFGTTEDVSKEGPGILARRSQDPGKGLLV